jgi:hypothetical protein
MKKKIILFISYLRTVVAFYVFGRFRNYSQEQIEYLEKQFKPTCKRDERLAKKMLDFNKNKLKNQQ